MVQVSGRQARQRGQQDADAQNCGGRERESLGNAAAGRCGQGAASPGSSRSVRCREVPGPSQASVVSSHVLLPAEVVCCRRGSFCVQTVREACVSPSLGAPFLPPPPRTCTAPGDGVRRKTLGSSGGFLRAGAWGTEKELLVPLCKVTRGKLRGHSGRAAALRSAGSCVCLVRPPARDVAAVSPPVVGSPSEKRPSWSSRRPDSPELLRNACPVVGGGSSRKPSAPGGGTPARLPGPWDVAVPSFPQTGPPCRLPSHPARSAGSVSRV